MIQSYLKLIGNGQKSARTLTEAEAQTVMGQIVSGAATPTQIGALMAILRFKEETVEDCSSTWVAKQAPFRKRLP